MATANGSASSAAATFSYAQAAKGKSTPVPSTPQPAESKRADASIMNTDEKVASWADDSQTMVDGQTSSSQDIRKSSVSSVGDTKSASASNGASTAVDSRSSSMPKESNELKAAKEPTEVKDTAEPSELKAAKESTEPNEHNDLNGTKELNEHKAKEPQELNGVEGTKEKEKEEATAPTDLPWRRRPQETEPTADSAAPQDESAEKPKKHFVEAPAPVVNIWAQRAQSTKAKMPPPNPPSAAPPRAQSSARDQPSVASSSAADALKSGDTSASARRMPSRAGKPEPTRSASLEERPSRAPRVDSNAGRTRVPSIEDAISWPKPETLKDNDRRQSQGKTDASKADTSKDAPAKQHGKNEKWVQMDFTPSVKFETPLPSTSRRGGRGAFRGATSRGGFGGPNGRGPSGSSSTIGAEDAATDGVTPKSFGPAKPRRTFTEDGSRPAPRGDAAKDPNVAESDARASPAEQDRQSPKTVQTNSIQTPGDVTTTATTAAARRRSSRAGDVDVNGTSNVDRRNGNSSGPGQASNGAPSRQNWNERRGDASGKPNDRGEFVAPSGRGEGRPERARGGKNRGGFFGGHNPHAATNGTPGPGAPFFMPNSPSFNGNANAGAGGFPGSFTPSRNGVRSSNGGGGNGNRASSFPADGSFAASMSGGPAVSPGLQGFYGFPAPVPQPAQYEAYVHNMAMMNGIANQLNYYFSFENMLKDLFLRAHMTSNGYVPLSFVAGFHRMKILSTDINMIRHVAESNPDLTVRMDTDGHFHVRKRDQWDQFVLPMEDRKPSAQNDGPRFVENMHQTHYEQAGPHRHPAEAVFQPFQQPPPPHMYPQFTPGPGPMSPGAAPGGANGGLRSPPLQQNNRHSGHFNYQPSASPFLTAQAQARSVDPAQDEPDTFPDEKIDQLTVVVRPKGKTPLPAEISRTTSHGSLDGETLKAAENGDESANGTHKREHSARIADIRRTLTSPPPTGHAAHGHKPQQASISSGVALFWIKEQGEEPEQLPPNSTYEPYVQVCANAMQQRRNAAPGVCPYDMDVLYQFWSHFLLRNFNTRMYTDFRTLALEDARTHALAGLGRLTKYYQDSMHSTRVIRVQVARDYLKLVVDEDRTGERSAFKQLRSAWRNGALNLKNRKVIQSLVSAELLADLDR